MNPLSGGSDGPRRVNCPTCGSTVGLSIGGEGTGHYVPIEDDHQVCEQRIAELERENARLRRWFQDAEANKNHYKKRLRIALGKMAPKEYDRK